MSLWVPPRVQAEMHREYMEYEKSLREQMLNEHVIERWDPDLKRISPHLHLVRASETAGDPALKPGYWHFLITPPNLAATVIPLEWPDGSFRAPDASMFEFLDAQDCWDDRVMRDRRRLREDLDRAQRAAKERERQERIEEIDERWRAAKRTQVSMNRDTPWTQNVAGRRAA